MSMPKGDKLYVNLGPSQVRQRLKGFGHGVRKVQSAGRNRAVIVHTATGRHLTELEQKFADVGFSSSETTLDEPIGNLRNLGPTSAGRLRKVGIQTVSDLKRLGPAAVYRLVKQHYPEASRNLLWALAAGLKGIDGRELAESDKQRLLGELRDS
jgi:DNA transformation protein and related proteins